MQFAHLLKSTLLLFLGNTGANVHPQILAETEPSLNKGRPNVLVPLPWALDPCLLATCTGTYEVLLKLFSPRNTSSVGTII